MVNLRVNERGYPIAPYGPGASRVTGRRSDHVLRSVAAVQVSLGLRRRFSRRLRVIQNGAGTHAGSDTRSGAATEPCADTHAHTGPGRYPPAMTDAHTGPNRAQPGSQTDAAAAYAQR